jgi:DNA repair protein SbcC/Rad50
MKAIRRIIIEDFQSHRYTDLEFSDGFNVIAGPSDQGKTAILRAIRWVLFNEPKGSDFIRVGASKAKVTLIMNDGAMVIRERSSSRNRYTVAIPEMEEQIFEGFGHSVPEEVMAATGVRTLQLDEDHQVAIQLGMQLDPPFLLDSNGAIKAKAIGRINGVHILDYAHKMTSSELSSKQLEERKIEAEIERTHQQLEQFADLDDWEQRLNIADQRFSALSRIEERSQWISARKQMRIDLKKKLEIARNYLANLSGLDQAADRLEKSTIITDRLDRLTGAKLRLVETRKSLTEAGHLINLTSKVTIAEHYLKQVEQLWQTEQQMAKALARQRTLQAENTRMSQILNKTKDVANAEQLFSKLQDLAKREEEAKALFAKKQEQFTLKLKIDAFLTRTRELMRADSLREQWEAEGLRFEQLKELAARYKERSMQIQKAKDFLFRMEGLSSGEKKMTELENVNSLLDQLRLFKQKYQTNRAEKNSVEEEAKGWNQEIEKLAEEYSEKLKQLGRCPICLGEIKEHTVQRIIQEIG